MPTNDKPRYPRERAEYVASCLVSILKPVCERIEIAGSIRRRKETVGDIEIVYVPKFGMKVVPPELFPKRISLADWGIDELLREEVIVRRKNKLGRVTWGTENKLAVHPISGIPVDFFATKEECWWNYLVCRTGGAMTNTQIALAAQRKGWKWQPYGTGFKVVYTEVPVKSERDVFEFVGLEYKEPWERE